MAVLGCFAILLTISVFWLYSTASSASTPNIVIFFVDDVSLPPLPKLAMHTRVHHTIVTAIYLATQGLL